MYAMLCLWLVSYVQVNDTDACYNILHMVAPTGNGGKGRRGGCQRPFLVATCWSLKVVVVGFKHD